MKHRCRMCNEWKDKSEFHKNKARKEGVVIYCKECRKRHPYIYNEEQKEKRRVWMKEYRRGYHQRLKMKAYEHYGGAECSICGYDTIGALCIDHIDNDGAEHRKEVGTGHLPAWLKRKGYPSGFQVLCRNCNWLKHLKENR